MSAPRFIMGKSKLSAATRGTTSTPSNRNAPPTQVESTLDDEDAKLPEFFSAADVCPVCKTDRFLNPKLRLMVSSCYHKMCESCMDRIFSLGPEPCPVCHTTIRKAHFKAQKFEDLGVQKELAIRRKMARIYNKVEEDFESPEAYNAYLEEVEEKTFRLIQSKDVEAIDMEMRQYELQNQDSIESNLTRAEREKEALRLEEEEERRLREQARNEYEAADREEALAKEEEKRLLIEALRSSDASADSVIKRIRTSALKRSSARSSTPGGHTPGGPSLRSFAGLKSANSTSVSEEPEDILSDLALYDSYNSLFKIRPRDGPGEYDEDLGLAVEKERGDEGGFVVEEVWEKAVRSSLAGLWLAPLGMEGGGDVVMAGV